METAGSITDPAWHPTAADQAFFVAYCEAVATYRRATAKLAELGELVLDDRGVPVRNP
jgi:hypothetical protein